MQFAKKSKKEIKYLPLQDNFVKSAIEISSHFELTFVQQFQKFKTI